MTKHHESHWIHFGLLILRVGIGSMFIVHGLPKILGGMEIWASLGRAMEFLGINWHPELWGFMAAFSEFFGGVFLILGLFIRPFCLLLFVTMAVASSLHFSIGEGIQGASHAIEMAIVFASLFFTGPGDYSIEHLIRSFQKP